MIVRCNSRLSRLTSSRIVLVVSGSSALVASSNSRIRGLLASARAMATRCCCPPDNCDGWDCACCSRPTRLSSLRVLSRFSAELRPEWRNASATLPSTVREGMRLYCWKTMLMDLRSCRSSLADRSGMDWPRTLIVPPEMGSSPLMHLTSVDFPAPLNPMIPNIEPSSMFRLTSCNAVYAPSGVS